jgi:lipoprotein
MKTTKLLLVGSIFAALTACSSGGSDKAVTERLPQTPVDPQEDKQPEPQGNGNTGLPQEGSHHDGTDVTDGTGG